MEKEGFVSLWIGNIGVDDNLLEYVELVYSDDGEWLPSQFLKDFNIDINDFDEDFIERVYYEKEVKLLTDLLTGCSYEDIVIPRFKNLASNINLSGINAAILLYNFEYDGNTQQINGNDYRFKYIGSVQYV